MWDTHATLCKGITLMLKVSNNIECMQTSHWQLYGIHLAMEGWTTLSWFLNGFNSAYAYCLDRCGVHDCIYHTLYY